MNKYKDLHKWMIIPMLIMQFGIFKDYWGDFSDNAWTVHIHYWTGTIWYLYLIIQPYYATHGKIEIHRTNGLVGIFLAGGVCLTALSMMHRDIVNAQDAITMPDRFGPFQSWFFLGVAVVEIIMMSAFGFAVIKSITQRKKMEDHAWWLISTIFIIMMPALGRGMQNIYVGLNNKDWPDINIMLPLYFTQILIISMLLYASRKYTKLKHPATSLALGVNLFIFLLEPIGKSEAIQMFLKTFIKG